MIQHTVAIHTLLYVTIYTDSFWSWYKSTKTRQQQQTLIESCRLFTARRFVSCSIAATPTASSRKASLRYLVPSALALDDADHATPAAYRASPVCTTTTLLIAFQTVDAYRISARF